MSAIIAMLNQKGGVAKTTTCLSLGAALAEMGHHVLLIDLDPQANLTHSLGLQPEQLRRTLVDTLMGTSSLVAVSQATDFGELDIVPAGQELTLANKVFYELPGYQYRLKQAIDRIDEGMYDYILLDCPPALDPLALNAMTAANLLVIPVQCEPYAAHSLTHLIRLARQMREQVNPGLDYRVLITMYDQRNKISRLVMEQMQNQLKPVLFETTIQVDTKLRECAAVGKPIMSHAPRSRGAQQYRDLAKEIKSTWATLRQGAVDGPQDADGQHESTAS